MVSRTISALAATAVFPTMLTAASSHSAVKLAYVLDVFETLADTPGWDQYVASDPKLRALAEQAKNNPEAKREYVAIFDERVASGALVSVEIPGTRRVLDKLASQAVLVAFSSGTVASIDGMLQQSGLGQYFPDIRLRVSDSDVLCINKGLPEAYTRLQIYLQAFGLTPALFVDNTERNVQAALKSGIGITSLYHLDRKSGLAEPQKGDGYIKIATLDQISEFAR